MGEGVRGKGQTAHCPTHFILGDAQCPCWNVTNFLQCFQFSVLKKVILKKQTKKKL